MGGRKYRVSAYRLISGVEDRAPRILAMRIDNLLEAYC